MVTATRRISMSDLARQKRLDVELWEGGDLTPRHSVGQAVEYYRDRLRIPDHNLNWSAFSRGVMLDGKSALADLEPADDRWTIMPEVAAGGKA